MKTLTRHTLDGHEGRLAGPPAQEIHIAPKPACEFRASRSALRSLIDIAQLGAKSSTE
jgi:hypothetical protein